MAVAGVALGVLVVIAAASATSRAAQLHPRAWGSGPPVAYDLGVDDGTGAAAVGSALPRVSLDGFIADDNDDVGPPFDWYGNGDVTWPTPVWGRDELRAGEMWNSNSVIAWLIARAGLSADAIHPPTHGRAPGWNAGLVVGRRQETHARLAESVRRRAFSARRQRRGQCAASAVAPVKGSEPDRRQSGYSSLRQARGSVGGPFGVRSSRKLKYGATNGSGAITV